MNTSVTLILRSVEDEQEHLNYVVEIEEDSKIHDVFSSENYFQALLVAKKVFNKIKHQQQEFGVMIELQYGRGVCYGINEFNFNADFDDDVEFYTDLHSEFELIKIKDGNNKAFREIVKKYKLNEYQEHKFLMKIKEIM